MDGLVYLLNQAGIALAQANAEIQRLTAENEELRAQVAAQTPEPETDTDGPVPMPTWDHHGPTGRTAP